MRKIKEQKARNDMQIVVDIADVTYSEIKKGKIYTSFRDVPQESINAIKNGTPLPKNHGRLIDADELVDNAKKEEEDGVTFCIDSAEELEIYFDDDAPTIIDAESEK